MIVVASDGWHEEGGRSIWFWGWREKADIVLGLVAIKEPI